MNKNGIDYTSFIKILGEELLPAMGCTESIVAAHCAATARETLGAVPDRAVVEANGNIIKNVKGVIVPNTGHLHGTPVTAAAGTVAGNVDKQLEIIASVTRKKQEPVRVSTEQVPIAVNTASFPLVFDIVVTIYTGKSYAEARITNYHTNIVLVEKDGEILRSSEIKGDSGSDMTDRSYLPAGKICGLANTVDVKGAKRLLDVQIAYNMDISEEGLKNDYDTNIDSVLLKANKEVMDNRNEPVLRLKTRAMTTAGNGTYTNGCELPAIISSGSENQGITASIPVIVYVKAMGVSEEELYRALVLSNLLGVHQKILISCLNAYCGTINVGTAAGCGIAHLRGAGLNGIIHILVNTLAIASGAVCDGAGASCAGKIALAVDNGTLGYGMYQKDQQLVDEDGVVKKGVENMIASVERLSRDGMAETDKEILRIMISD